MAFDDADPPHYGSNVTALENNEELFAMTAIQNIHHESPPSEDSSKSPGRAAGQDTSVVEDEDGNNAEEEFFEDIGYNKLVVDYNDAGVEDYELLAQINEKVEQCRQLQRTVNSVLKADLIQLQKKNADASQQDAAKQKESDDKMEAIRRMEEDANGLQNSIPMHEDQVKKLLAGNEEIKQKIAEGPGWTDAQSKERSSIANDIDGNRSEAEDKNSRLADLRAQLGLLEVAVETSIKQRDESIAHLDALNGNLDAAREKALAVEQQYNDAERSRGVLTEALRVANAELVELKSEYDGEKQITDHCAQEVEELKSDQQTCSKAHDGQAQVEEETLKELIAIRVENKDIENGNSDKRQELHLLSKTRDIALKNRAKAGITRELINKKTATSDTQYQQLQKRADTMNISAAKIENTDIPLARKTAESLQREIKRQEHELDLVGRKIGLSKKSNARVADITKSNENTLLSQQTEQTSIKKDIDELQKMRRSLVAEEQRDEEQLNRIGNNISEKQMSLASLRDSNRLLESAVIQAEEMVSEQHKSFEVTRGGYNKESKTLIGLREDVHLSKVEFATLMTQLKAIKDDIFRSDDLVFKEHTYHHNVDAERVSIESDIKRFRNNTEKLDKKRLMNHSVVARLGQDIDNEHKQRELLRQKYRHIMNEKDIIMSRLVATEVERSRVNETLETCGAMNKESESRYRKLNEGLDAARNKTEDLTKEKEHIKALLETQRDQNEVLAALVCHAQEQLDKNSALVVEIGRPINLHRWRYLRDKAPLQYMMLEKVHKLQRQAIGITDRIATQSCNISSKKSMLRKLRDDVSGQESIDGIRSHLSALKLEFHGLNKKIKFQETELTNRIDQTEDIKSEMLKLEKRKMEIKADYVVSVVSSVVGAR